MDPVAIIVGATLLVLAFQPWFWLIAFFVAGLAALFAMLASIVHFQILAALGFFFLMFLCWAGMAFVASYIRDGKPTVKTGSFGPIR